ncbi:alpha/beta hydrolase-fold protein [Ramlibacter pallidus]|uniref:Alpha/beta hydrolase n=1 Tax=Ramlibacter pallidus TaxID=2780087 RepID=A0ABR9S698_9BURK|nr:alpha/beta hydrolase-fold protein [Ramlibacter pallidus]MBE7369041.1 alpha/beta hydrolase [Ramlibacter pallidus]
MIPTRRRTLLAFLLALSAGLSSCGGGGGGGDEAPDAGAPGGVGGEVVFSTVKATASGQVYTVQTFLPASYAAGSTRLPAIYVTEADAMYGANGQQSRFDAFKGVMQRRGTQAILVGIHGTARRNTDFLLPGAAHYLDFIAKDLAPQIERQYRADAAKRMLSGLSHGGYFVVAALVLEASAGTPSFSHYLSTEASFGGHGNTAGFLEFEKQLDASGRPAPATLFLAGAPGFNGTAVVDPLHAQMTAHAHAGLTLVKAQYATTHVGADLPAFEEALARFAP